MTRNAGGKYPLFWVLVDPVRKLHPIMGRLIWLSGLLRLVSGHTKYQPLTTKDPDTGGTVHGHEINVKRDYGRIVEVTFFSISRDEIRMAWLFP